MSIHRAASKILAPHRSALDAASRIVDRALRLVAPVGRGEGVTTLLMMINIFVLLTCYYVLKVVREPLILLGGGGAELKAYASAGQTLLLLAVVPAFGALASRVNRLRLLTIVQGCFADPIYGGNVGKVFWKAIGYPGLPAVHAQDMIDFRGKPFPGAADPKSIADFA